ncbi:MAG: tRNA (adenine-N1)-methyltransferase [Actinomycetota bacterium]|nr:tRNA (adenine-N1)-methyltransferase [Actinomycetota bacterium]
MNDEDSYRPPDERPLEAGERVLLVDGRDRRYMITLHSGRQFHSHRGTIDHDELIGSPAGVTVTSSGGARMLAFRPGLADFVLKMQRGAQVVYPKDLGMILVYADVFPGAQVLEAGSGSGSLTLTLARAVGSEGRVVSYEVREDHHERAVENVNEWFSGSGGKPHNVEMRLGDVFADVDERGFDRLVFDLPEPWRAVGTTTEALAPGGLMCCYLPTVPQVQQTVEAMRRGGFALVNTFETMLRTWNVDGPSVRPDHRMVAHTGFIIVGRKLARAHKAGTPGS